MIHVQKILKKNAKRVLFYVSFMPLYLINITKSLLFEQNQDEVDLYTF